MGQKLIPMWKSNKIRKKIYIFQNINAGEDEAVGKKPLPEGPFQQKICRISKNALPILKLAYFDNRIPVDSDIMTDSVSSDHF